MLIQRPSRNPDADGGPTLVHLWVVFTGKAHAQGRQPETSHTVTNTALIAAEVRYFTFLKEEINDGKFKSFDLEESYVETMKSFGIASTSLPWGVLEKTIKQK